MSIDLRLLRALTATVDEGSVNRAALVLHITQPALSRQLKQLESQLGVALFERAGRQLRLTPAGEELLPGARDLLGQADALERTATSVAAGRLDRVRLALPATTLTDVLAPFLATFGPDDPIPVVGELDPVNASAALRDGADLVVATRPPGRRLASRPIAVLPVWAFVRSDDPWADREHVDVAELVLRPLILLNETFRPRTLLDAAVESAGLSYDEVVECGNAQVAQALSAAGRGVCVLTDDPRFGLVPLHIRSGETALRISLYAAWERSHHASGKLAEIAARLAAFCVEQYGPGVQPVPRATPDMAPGATSPDP